VVVFVNKDLLPPSTSKRNNFGEQDQEDLEEFENKN